MQEQLQLNVDPQPTPPIESAVASPMPEFPKVTEQLSNTGLSVDQEAEVDKLVDNGGLNYTEALRRVGAVPLAATVEVTPVAKPDSRESARRAARSNPPKRTWRAKNAADREAPDHIRVKR